MNDWVKELDSFLKMTDNERKLFNCCGYVTLRKAAIFIDKIMGDYNTLIGISPSLLFSKLKELGYKISDFEFEN